MDNLIDSEQNNDNLILKSNYFPFQLSMYIEGFPDEKSENKFIKQVKRIIRSSPSYREWVKYIREVQHVNRCVLTNESDSELTVEIHHHPIALHNIIQMVMYKKMATNEKFNEYTIQNDVMTLHFENKVGYIPIITSLHEKFHNGFLDLPIKYVQGYWELFYDEYKQYASHEIIQTIEKYQLIVDANEELYMNYGHVNTTQTNPFNENDVPVNTQIDVSPFTNNVVNAND